MKKTIIVASVLVCFAYLLISLSRASMESPEQMWRRIQSAAATRSPAQDSGETFGELRQRVEKLEAIAQALSQRLVVLERFSGQMNYRLSQVESRAAKK